MHKPANDPIFAFIEKKRGEGKSSKLAMVAGLNKFLRVYYGQVFRFAASALLYSFSAYNFSFN